MRGKLAHELGDERSGLVAGVTTESHLFRALFDRVDVALSVANLKDKQSAVLALRKEIAEHPVLNVADKNTLLKRLDLSNPRKSRKSQIR